MRIDLLERLVLALSLLATLLVATLVGLFTFAVPQSSGISKEEEVAAIAMNDWLEDARNIERTGTIAPRWELIHVEDPGPTRGPTKALGEADDYVVREGDAVSESELVP